MGFIAKYKRELKDVWEELVALTITTLGSGISGMTLGLGNIIISMKNSVLMLAPAIMDMRGNIYSSLGSRLSSLLHLGYIKPKISRNPLLLGNLFGVLALKSSMPIYIGFIASIAYFLTTGILDYMDLTLIALLTSFFTFPIMLAVTFAIAFITYRRGLDPDNFASPIITLAGDAISLPILFLSTYIVMNSPLGFKPTLILVGITVSAISLLYITFSGEAYAKKIVYEATPTLMICGLLEIFAGSLLVINVNEILEKAGMLTIVPGFIGNGGALGGILAARLSTKLHLGEIEPKLIPSTKAIKEFIKALVVSLIIYPALGVYGYSIALLLKLPTPSLNIVFLTTLVAGMILSAIIIIIVYFISIISFKRGVDPDNITIPLITSIVDAIGAFVLLYSFLVIFRT